MLRAIFLLSFIVLVFAGIFQYTNKTSHNIEENIMTRVHTSLSNNNISNQKDTNIFVTVDGRNVTLSGTTSSTDIRSNIEDTVRSVFGVGRLTNNINIVSSKKVPKKGQKKGLSLSTALSPNKEPVKEANKAIQDPVVINIISCDPAVCAKATAQKIESTVK